MTNKDRSQPIKSATEQDAIGRCRHDPRTSMSELYFSERSRGKSGEMSDERTLFDGISDCSRGIKSAPNAQEISPCRRGRRGGGATVLRKEKAIPDDRSALPGQLRHAGGELNNG